MDARNVPLALNARLGPDGVAGLLELVESARSSWTDEVTTLAMDRLDTRLAKESGGLRAAIAASEGRLRGEIAAMRNEVRSEIGDCETRLRKEIGDCETRLQKEIGDAASKLRDEMQDWGQSIRTEILNGVSQLRQEIAQQQVQLVKLCFTFWVGQTLVIVAVVGAIVGALAR